MTDEQAKKMSPLSQTIERDGHSILVEIYEGDGGWILEVVDEFNNSTVWEDVFKTDQDALDEILECIEQEGIGIFVATESWQPK